MKRFLVLSAGALVFLFGIAAPHARADDVSWSYSWSGTASVANDGGGGVKFIFGSGDLINGQNGVTAALLEGFGSAGNVTNGSYALTMHLVDQKSKESADLTFGGVFNGTTDFGLLNEFSQPQAQIAKLGGNEYGVVIGLYAAPGAPGSGVQGVIGTNVIVTPQNTQGPPPPPPVSNVPEPSTLALACLGLSALGLRWGWRRGRRPAACPCEY